MLKAIFARYQKLLKDHMALPNQEAHGQYSLEDYIYQAQPYVPTLENVITDMAERRYVDNMRTAIVTGEIRMSAFIGMGAPERALLLDLEKARDGQLMIGAAVDAQFGMDMMDMVETSFSRDRARDSGIMVIEARPHDDFPQKAIRLVEAPRKDRPDWRHRHDKGHHLSVR